MGAPSSDSAGIRQVYRALKEAGNPVIFVFDGEENVPVKNENECVDAVTAVDDAFANTADGWVRFVLGNAPEEVVCDYTVNLSDVLDPILDRWMD